MRSFFAELKRRNVIRMAGLYLVGAWLTVQVAETLLPIFGTPGWVLKTLVVLLALGFVPALMFAWIFELTPQGLKRDAELSASDSIAPQTAQRMNRTIIALLVIALAYFGVDKFLLAPRREAALVASVSETSQSRGAASIPAAPRERSIAVLPFVNLSSDPEQTYFSDGLSEDLITALSQLGGLKVIARNSSFRFRDSKDDPRAIGAQLNVVHLLTGSVRRSGEQVRISADLVDVSDGRTLWSQRYDRAYSDLFALQDEITTAVAQALKARLLNDPGAAAQDDRPPSGDLDAYNAYLQARFHADRGSRAEFEKAFGYFEEAIRRDPSYARAHAGLASARVLHASNFLSGAEWQANRASARRSINTALELAPDSSFAHVVNARVLTSAELRWVEAEREARRAVALAPTDPDALITLAQALAALGDAAQSVTLLRQGLQRDPLHAIGWNWLSITLNGLGQFDEAQQAAERAVELAPDSDPVLAQRALVQVLRGNHRDAVALAEAVPAGYWREVALAISTQQAGDTTAADRTLREIIDNSADFAAFQIAETYAQRREPEKVFEWLEQAWTNRDPGLRRLLTDPFIAPYRDDPRFAAFCRKIGLPVLGDLAK